MTQRQKLTRRLLVAVASFVGVSASVWALSGLSDSSKEASTDSASLNAVTNAARRLPVQVCMASQSGPDFMTRHFTGIVVPRRESEISSKSVGRVERILVDVGDEVRAGELLIELDHAQLEASRDAITAQLGSAQHRLDELTKGPRKQEIEQAEARVREAKSRLELSEQNFSRYTELFQSQSVSKQEYDEQKFAVDSANSQLDGAVEALDALYEGTRGEQIAAQRALVDSLTAELKRVNVQLTEQSIVAPYDGAIQSRFADEGIVVSPGARLLKIVESKELEIHVGLPSDLARSAESSHVTASIDSQPIQIYLDRMSPTVDPFTHTRQVVFRIADAAITKVAVGEAVRVELHIPTRAGTEDDATFWIPTEALVSAARGLWAAYVAVPQDSDRSSATIHSDKGSPMSLQSTTEKTTSKTMPCVLERRQVELIKTYGSWSQVRGPVSPTEYIVSQGVHRVTNGQAVDAVLK